MTCYYFLAKKEKMKLFGIFQLKDVFSIANPDD